MNPAPALSALTINSLSFDGFSEACDVAELDYVMLLYEFDELNKVFLDDDEDGAAMPYSEPRLLKLLLLHWRDLAGRHSNIEQLTPAEYRSLYLDSFKCSDNMWQFLLLEFIRLKAQVGRRDSLPPLRDRWKKRSNSLTTAISESVLSDLNLNAWQSRNSLKLVPNAGSSCQALGGDLGSVAPDPVALQFVSFLSSLHDNLVLHILTKGPISMPARFRAVFKALIQVQCKSHILFMSMIMHLKKNDRDRLFEFEGTWQPDVTCAICYESLGAFINRCCNIVVCEYCLTQYINTQLTGLNRLHIECPASDCRAPIRFSSVWLRLSEANRRLYERLRDNQIQSATKKLCPNCMHFYELSREQRELVADRKRRRRLKTGFNVKCHVCQWEWCFKCQTPVHSASCRKNTSTDKLLMKWANSAAEQAQQVCARRARKCPSCHVLVERHGGCPHMKCAKCKCSWCFDCGRRWIKVKHVPFMRHDSKYFIFGCSRTLLPDNAHLRQLVRVGVFCGITVLIIPVSAIAGVVMVALGVLLGLPFGCFVLGMKLHKLSNSA